MSIPDTPIITLQHPEQGMPVHPIIEDRPVLWEDPGDKWIFRKTTNVLRPKIIDVESHEDPMIRYSVCAIKRALQNGGGIDFVIWMESEEVQSDKRTSVVVPTLCFGPSRASHISMVMDTVDAAMTAFAQVYKNPVWITLFDYTDEIFKENEHS